MKKRGFTLIELLAVILILGIIALIAIPIVNKIIKESRKDAFENTVNNVVGAIEDACQLQVLKGETITTTYTFANGLVTPSLNLKGKLPNSGKVTVDSKCKVSLNVNNGVYSATKEYDEENVTIVDGVIPTTYAVYANGTAVYFNPVTGTKCTAGEAVSTTGTKTGCMKWYAFNDIGGSESSTINLILDHNTTALIAWNNTGTNVNGPKNVLTQLQADTSAWTGVTTRSDSYSVSNGTSTYTIDYSTYKARLITAAEVATISGNSSFVEATSIVSNWFYFDSNNQTQTVTTTGASSYDWLFDYTNGCTSYGCNIADDSTYGYWTSTTVSGNDSRTWYVGRGGYMDTLDVVYGDFYGVRPVITVQKSKL